MLPTDEPSRLPAGNETIEPSDGRMMVAAPESCESAPGSTADVPDGSVIFPPGASITRRTEPSRLMITPFFIA